MRFSGPSSVAQVLARAWLVAAAASALLPARWRLGWWLPLHLALAGAGTAAIAGAMPRFAAALCAARAPADRWAPVALFTAGIPAVVLGRALPSPLLAGAGGAAFAAGALALGWALLRAWRTGRNHRHRVIMGFYAAAVLSLLAGAVLGGLLGAGAVGAGSAAPLRRAHAALNLLGFVSLTVAGSVLILLPVALRVRAPEARGWSALVGLAAGQALQAAGYAADRPVAVVAGAALSALGALALAGIAARALRRLPAMAEPAPALHLGAAVAWLAAALAAHAVAEAAGPLRGLPLPLLAALGLGFVVQTLLGAWSYLLPVSAPGGREVRHALLARASRGAGVQAVAFNAAATVVVLAAAGRAPSPAGPAGLAAVAATTAVVLVKLVRRPAPLAAR